jgi:DNA-binding beta-propeller fold protein YncE
MQLRSYVALSLILTSLLAVLALGGCGTNATQVCQLSGCCGPAGDACAVPQFLYALGLSGQVSAFPINRSTGLPGTPVSTPGPTNSLGLAALNNQFLYASNPQLSLSGPAGSIDAWSINLGTGALTTVPGSPFSLGPLSIGAGLAVNKASQVLYVGDAGKIDALKADTTGALADVIGSPFPGGLNLFLTVDPQNRFLFASDDTPPGNVLAYAIDPASGALSTVSGSPFATIPRYVGNTQPGAITVDSTGSFVYTLLVATNQIAAFKIITPSGALTPIPGSPFNSGTHPLALATVNNFLYVSNAQDGTISGYTIDPSTGELKPLAGSPFAIFAGPLAASPFGGFLYTTSSGGLLTLSIDPQTGALAQVGSPIPYGGAQLLILVQ